MTDYLHEKDEDIDDVNDASISKEERQYRERLRLTIGELKISPTQGTYWSTDDTLKKLLKYRPSMENMNLILRPMSYLSKDKRPLIYESYEASQHDRYRKALQKQLIEYFLEKYSSKDKSGQK